MVSATMLPLNASLWTHARVFVLLWAMRGLHTWQPYIHPETQNPVLFLLALKETET